MGQLLKAGEVGFSCVLGHKLTLSLGLMENCQTSRLNSCVGVMAGKTTECKCTRATYYTFTVLNAETNEKLFLDCIFDTNDLSTHIMTLPTPPAPGSVSQLGGGGGGGGRSFNE